MNNKIITEKLLSESTNLLPKPVGVCKEKNIETKKNKMLSKKEHLAQLLLETAQLMSK